MQVIGSVKGVFVLQGAGVLECRRIEVLGVIQICMLLNYSPAKRYW
jgi:hypothetical protein